MKPQIKNATIGSDPEYGVTDGVNPRSVIGFLPGTKKRPYPLNKHVSCQVDNVGAECCIPPCSTEEEFIMYMTMAKTMTQEQLQKANPALSLVSVSSQTYDDQELNHPTAQQFGCEPSYCVYTKDISPRPTAEEVGNLRSFGFHIHVGFPIEKDENQIDYVNRLIMCMDIMLGVPSIILDTDERRRKIYGNAGDLRFRTSKNILIIEYRTLGGAMHASEELLRFVYRQTQKAIELFNSDADISKTASMVQKCIDTGNIAMAEELLKTYNINLNIETYAVPSSVRNLA